MAEVILTNQADFTGLYGENECNIVFSSNEVSTTIIRGLTATKTADKTCWVDGPLTYEITVENDSGATVTNGIFTDYLDPSLVALDTGYGVFVDGILTTDYSYAVGVLTINLPTMNDGVSHTISFRVVQV